MTQLAGYISSPSCTCLLCICTSQCKWWQLFTSTVCMLHCLFLMVFCCTFENILLYPCQSKNWQRMIFLVLSYMNLRKAPLHMLRKSTLGVSLSVSFMTNIMRIHYADLSTHNKVTFKASKLMWVWSCSESVAQHSIVQWGLPIFLGTYFLNFKQKE